MSILWLVSWSALAWQPIRPLPYCWDELPVEYYVSELCSPALPDGYCVEAIDQGFQSWDEAVPCADLGGEYLGPAEVLGFSPNDGLTTFTFEDPYDELEAGVLAGTLTFRVGTAFVLNQETYVWAKDADIVFNDGVDWITHEEALEEPCDGVDIVAVITHELGHLYGLGHSCDEFQACTDPLLVDAVMYWIREPCGSVEPNEDDVAGMNALYAPTVEIVCADGLADAALPVPVEIACTVVRSRGGASPSDATWHFGDGGEAEGLSVHHTYTEPGTYSISSTASGLDDECAAEQNPDGEWTAEASRFAWVRACGTPAPVFTAAHVDGLTWQLSNETDVSVYGCLSDIVWTVYRGEEPVGDPVRTSKGWEPVITFPEPGVYTVIANIGGVAGTGAAALTLDVKDQPGNQRACGGTRAMLLLPLLALALRRRSRVRRP